MWQQRSGIRFLRQSVHTRLSFCRLKYRSPRAFASLIRRTTDSKKPPGLK